MTNIIFLYQKPHRCHEIWAKSINAEFVFFKELNKLNISERYDVILIEGGAPIWQAYQFKRKYANTKLIYLNADETVLIWKKGLLKSPFYFTKWRYAIESVDGIISVSNLVSIRKNLNLKIPEEIVRPFIEFRYDQPKYNPQNQTIITVGYYHPKQGVDILIEAFKLVKKENPHFKDLKLYLVGKGYPKKLARNDIILTGFVRDLEEVYKIAGLYIHAGRYQAHPVAPLEAMHYGIPAIVTSKTGVYEVLKPELVAKCDPKDLAEKIEWFFSLDKKEKIKISRYCYGKSLKFLRERSVKKFIKTFENLVT